MHSFGIAQKVFHRRVGLDVHHPFTDGAASLTDTLLAFLVRKLHVLLLHRPAILLLHHVGTEVFRGIVLRQAKRTSSSGSWPDHALWVLLSLSDKFRKGIKKPSGEGRLIYNK